MELLRDLVWVFSASFVAIRGKKIQIDPLKVYKISNYELRIKNKFEIQNS